MHALEIKDGEVDQLRYATRRCACDVDRPRDRVDHRSALRRQGTRQHLPPFVQQRGRRGQRLPPPAHTQHLGVVSPGMRVPISGVAGRLCHRLPPKQPEVERIAADRGQAVRSVAQPRARHRDQDRQHDARVGLQCGRSSAARS